MTDGVASSTGTGQALGTLEPLSFLQVDADSIDGGWTTETGSTVLFSSIDEHVIPNDSDYIVSSGSPSNDICKVSLGNPPSGFVIQPFRVRYRTGRNGVRRVDLGVRLLQGTTPIAAWTHINVSPTPATVVQVLTNAQFITITDFTNLFLEFTANLISGTLAAENGADLYVAENGTDFYVTEDA